MEEFPKRSIISFRNTTVIFMILIFLGIISILFREKFTNEELKAQKISSILVEDMEGHIYTLKFMLEGAHWMTDNLNIQAPESYCYSDDGANNEFNYR